MLQAVYTQYNWLPWKFTKVQTDYWTHSENQKQYMEWLSKELKIEHWEDWYQVTRKSITGNYGTSLLRLYEDSPSKLIISFFPQFPWIPWKFNVPNNFWADPFNQKQYMIWLGKELKIASMDDWYHITKEVILPINSFLHTNELKNKK